MFLIPDFSKLEVNVSVHESMGPRVRVGMKTRVCIASRPGLVIAGRVVAIDMLSSPNWKEWDDNARHFFARVQLDQTPASALTLCQPRWKSTPDGGGALVIPVEAVAVVDGEESCYVVGEDGLERRSIKTCRATRDLLEVTEGLQEGEHVVSRSLDVDGIALDSIAHHAAGAVARNQSASPRISAASARSMTRARDPALSSAGNRTTS